MKIDFENQILALFDVYFWPSNKSHEKNQIHFCDQCNHTINLKCFYQIRLTWWKIYIGQPSPQQLQALFEYQAQIKANVTAAAAAASAASNKTGQ